MRADKEKMEVFGKTINVYSLEINDKKYVISGRVIKTATIKNEWYEDVDDPEAVIRTLRTAKPKPDMFSFWQRIPEFEPKYPYYIEWDEQAVLQTKGVKYWLEQQTKKKARWALRKAQKAGILIKSVPLDDEFVHEVMNIFNEQPIKRGKPFRHYGKDFETVREMLSRDMAASEFYGAFYEDKMIGFMKLIYADRFLDPVMFMCKNEYLEKGPNNIMMARAVEICEEKNIPYIHYGPWRDESHSIFLSHNGFEKVRLPRYYVPITLKGALVLKLNLHHGLRGIIPKNMYTALRKLRSKWLALKHSASAKPAADVKLDAE